MASRLFGLDIGRSFVKVAQVDVGSAKKVLKAAALVATPEGGMQSESELVLSKTSQAIKDCVESAKIGTEKCVVSLAESQVVSRLIKLPPLTDKELASAINWEAEQYIPLPIKDVVLQYSVVGKAEAGSETAGKMDVLLVASPKRVVEKYLKVVRDAGFAVEALETESAAMTRALTRPGEAPTIIVSLGASSTELVVCWRGSVFFTRSIASGGVDLTRAIMAEFNLPHKQAEEYKQTYGILEDKLSGKVAAVLKPILEIIKSEILRALEFSRNQIKDAKVERVIICGGGAYLPGLSEYLVQSTSLEVVLGDPWADFVKEGTVLSQAGKGSLYSVATGLAMRS